MRGVIVTGTDTGVGKTIVSAAIMAGLAPGRRLYWKLVQTGFPGDDDTTAVRELARLGDAEVRDPVARLAMPASPHEAALAERCRVTIAPPDLVLPTDRAVVVEGAGGLLVPLDDTLLLADVFARLDLPLVIVARPDVGTINHTLLTLSETRRRRLRVAALVFSRPPTSVVRDVVASLGEVDPIVVPDLGSPPRIDAAVAPLGAIAAALGS